MNKYEEALDDLYYMLFKAHLTNKRVDTEYEELSGLIKKYSSLIEKYDRLKWEVGELQTQLLIKHYEDMEDEI